MAALERRGGPAARGRVDAHAAGWSSSVARRAHNPEVTGSNPVPATKSKAVPVPGGGLRHIGLSAADYTRVVAKVEYQRNALAPGILGAVVLLFAPFAVDTEWFTLVQYLVAILAAIVAWFALQARHWWWLVVFVPIVVLWNPVWPFDFSGQLWLAAQFIAAAAFLLAGVLIRSPRE